MAALIFGLMKARMEQNKDEDDDRPYLLKCKHCQTYFFASESNGYNGIVRCCNMKADFIQTRKNGDKAFMALVVPNLNIKFKEGSLVSFQLHNEICNK